MNKSMQSGEQYWQLQTKKGSAILIGDPMLPPAAKMDRIYLYNTERNAMIEYDKTIVFPKLTPLSGEQLDLAQAQFNTNWLLAKKEFINKYGKRIPSAANDDKASADQVQENEPELEDTDFND